MQNWYAVQVMTGKEDKTAVACRRVLNPEFLKDCFVPKCERMKRYQGEWHKEERPMFPGYLFFVTDEIGQLFREVKQLPQMTRILGDGEELIALQEKEIMLLQRIEDERHLVKMSEGYIIGDRVVITSGPMQQMCGIIKKIDRHKRIATIQMEMFGRIMDVAMGLEIVKKV